MVPNSRDNKINGVNKVIIKGHLTQNDKKLISDIFDVDIKETLEIRINDNQVLIFEESNEYTVEVLTHCNNEIYNNKSIAIENINVKNMG